MKESRCGNRHAGGHHLPVRVTPVESFQQPTSDKRLSDEASFSSLYYSGSFPFFDYFRLPLHKLRSTKLKVDPGSNKEIDPKHSCHLSGKVLQDLCTP